MLLVIHSSRSLMYIKNKIGPSTDPCDTPLKTYLKPLHPQLPFVSCRLVIALSSLLYAFLYHGIVLVWTTSCTPALGALFVCVSVCPWSWPHTARRTTPHCSAHERMADHVTQSGLICMPDGAIHYKLYLLKLTTAVDNFVFRIIKGAVRSSESTSVCCESPSSSSRWLCGLHQSFPPTQKP